MKTRFLPPALLPLSLTIALTLAGCGEHGGVGAESTSKQAVSISTETKTDASREIKQNQSAKATISMPAAALIIQTLRAYISQLHASGDPAHIAAARAIVAVTRPEIAWPIHCFGCPSQADWAHTQAERVAFANLVLSEVAAHLPKTALSDPSAAHKTILAAFLSIPAETLDAAYKQAAREIGSGRTFTPDFSGSEGVHYFLNGEDFKGGPTGWVWSKNGAAWFGDGVLSGQKVEVALESAINTGATESSGSATTTGTNTEKASSGSAGVK